MQPYDVSLFSERFDKYSLFKVMEYSCSGVMSRFCMKGVLNLGTTTVAMLYVSLFRINVCLSQGLLL